MGGCISHSFKRRMQSLYASYAMRFLFSALLLMPSFAVAVERAMTNHPINQPRDRATEAAARVHQKLEQALFAQDLRYGAHVFIRIFKREHRLELWLAGANGRYALFHSYAICTWSGDLGPKVRQGDNQAPEGFYRVGLGQLNPHSRFHLAFNLGYPNAYDRAHGRTGDFLMVHGACVSIGCYAMGDAAIEEIYTLMAAALHSGQTDVHVQIFPFRLEQQALAIEHTSPWFGFWSELKAGYDAFEHTHIPPQVVVRNGHYVVKTL